LVKHYYTTEVLHNLGTVAHFVICLKRVIKEEIQKSDSLRPQVPDALTPLLSSGPVLTATNELDPVQLLHLGVVALLRAVLALGLAPGPTREPEVRARVRVSAFTTAAALAAAATTAAPVPNRV